MEGPRTRGPVSRSPLREVRRRYLLAPISSMVTRIMESPNRLTCSVIATDSWSSARALDVTTLHGRVATPIFMPVATQAALRCVDLPVADELDFQVLLANTYHLLLRPGPEIMAQHGGIHRFMNWQRGVLTDSGGFQIFSLSRQLSISEE